MTRSKNQVAGTHPETGPANGRRRLPVRPAPARIRPAESEARSFYAAQAESFDYIGDYLASLPTE